MKGYYRAPDATAARMSPHGFHTGDYAYADRDGFLYYQGRRDDIFKSAGEKISAQEIEEVVLQHEAVSEAAVVSLADPRVEAVPVAYIVLRPGASCTERELQTFCGRRLSRRKVPRAVHFVEELSKTASGKIQKYRLRDLAVMSSTVTTPASRRGRPVGMLGAGGDARAALSRTLLRAGQRACATRAALSPPALAEARCASRSMRSRCASWRPARATRSSSSTTSPGRRPLTRCCRCSCPSSRPFPTENIRILVALGAHRPMVRVELERKLGAAILDALRRRAASSRTRTSSISGHVEPRHAGAAQSALLRGRPEDHRGRRDAASVHGIWRRRQAGRARAGGHRDAAGQPSAGRDRHLGRAGQP